MKPSVALVASAPLPTTRDAQKRLGVLARGKKGLDRWVTAAALAALFTLLVFGGLQWLNVWVG
jgi:hypothetical protein